jgi:Uma2 family endonuclease
MSTTLPKKLTYEDYIQMTQPDSAQYQLIHGEIITTTSPNTRHQRIIINLTYYHQTYLMKKNIGQIFVAQWT